jgi:uncharacterized protein with HEPN domain
MTRPEVIVLLGDIEEAATAILNEASGRSLNDYLSSRSLRSSIEREFIIIGEALKNALAMEPTLPITKGRLIVDFRNLLVHQYSVVDDDYVWGLIQRDLSRLLAEVRALLPSSP